MGDDDTRALGPGLEAILPRLRWTSLSSLLAEGVVSCVDGRHHANTIGAPGGNAGELALLLAAAEDLAGTAFDEPTVQRLLRAHVARFGRFYLHTDDHAARALADHVGRPAAEAETLHRAPPPELRNAVLTALPRPEHTGCGHLALMLTAPEAYGTRAALVAAVIRSFYSLLWEGLALELAILEGRHAECAVLVFDTDRPVDEDTMIPNWCGCDQAPSVFSGHPPAARWMRAQAASWLVSDAGLPALTGTPAGALVAASDALAARQLGETLDRLAPDLPRHRLLFRAGALE
jgi:hypothetical protein